MVLMKVTFIKNRLQNKDKNNLVFLSPQLVLKELIFLIPEDLTRK